MKYWILVVLFTIYFTHAAHPQRFNFEGEPEWIKTIVMPESGSLTKYDISSGYYLTMADYQVNLEEDAYYIHEVFNIISYSGITKASQLLITFDTSFQKIKIHHLYIWRKGEKIDRTKDLSFEFMNNEYNLQNGIYMGKITAYDNLNDIRKDDLIDFAYTLVGHNPIFDNEKYILIPLESSNPIDVCSVRILFLKDKDYTYKCVGCDSLIFSTSITEKYQQIEINSRNVKGIKLEDGMPGWIIPFKYFTLSSFKTWKEVNNWAQNVFALKSEPDLESVFKEIYTGNETFDEKINKIIDFVQDDIRYMGIESGIGSIKPYPPDQVIKNRYGDCKDKSLLLVSLLKKIGINDAYPVLVNSIMKQEIIEFFPSNEIFDHCIVKFEYDNQTYWVDPTFTQQGGDFRSLSVFDFGRALVIGDPSDSIQLMTPHNPCSVTRITEELTVSSFVKPASLGISSERQGIEADIRRNLFEHITASDISKSVLDDLLLLYPTVNKTSDVKISDDIVNNVFTTSYNFEIDGFWQDGDKMSDKNAAGYWFFKFEPQTMYQYLKLAACNKRTYDFALTFPLNLEYFVIFHFPEELLVYDNYVKYENAAFYFDETIEQLSTKSFQIKYNLKTKGSSIKAENYENVCEQTTKISKGLPLVIYFNK